MTQSRDFYAILGVPKSVDDAALKKAYRKLAMKWHPDKNLKNKKVAEAKFKDIGEAYAILSDPEKRKVYDMYGEDGLKAGVKPGEGGNGPQFSGGGFENIDPNEIFARFFGGGGPRSHGFSFASNDRAANGFGSQGGSPFVHVFGNTQEPMDIESDFGYQQQFQPRKRKLEKQKPCQREVFCTLEENFHGVTKKIKVTRKEVDRNGQQSTGTNILEIPIKAGMKEGTKFTFHGEGDQSLNKEPQDLVFTLKNRKHPTFTRKGDDLHCTVGLTLSEALKGSQVKVPTIEGKELNVLSQPLKDSKQTLTMIGQGMVNSKTHQRGNMIIDFKIAFQD